METVEEIVEKILKDLKVRNKEAMVEKIKKEVRAQGIRDPITLGCVIAEKIAQDRIQEEKLSSKYCDAAQKIIFSLPRARPKAKKELYLLWLKRFKHFKQSDFRKLFPKDKPDEIRKEIEYGRLLIKKTAPVDVQEFVLGKKKNSRKNLKLVQ